MSEKIRNYNEGADGENNENTGDEIDKKRAQQVGEKVVKSLDENSYNKIVSRIYDFFRGRNKGEQRQVEKGVTERGEQLVGVRDYLNKDKKDANGESNETNGIKDLTDNEFLVEYIEEDERISEFGAGPTDTESLLQEMVVAVGEDEALDSFGDVSDYIRNNTQEAFGTRRDLEARIDDIKRKLNSLSRDVEKIRQSGYDISEKKQADIKQRMVEAIEANRKRINDLYTSNTDAFYALHGEDIMQNVENLKNGGRIVETEYVKEKGQELRQILEDGQIPFVWGETGAGKTELARKVSGEFSNKEPIVIRGHKGMDKSELFGRMVLHVKEGREDIQKVLDERMEEYDPKNTNMTLEEFRNFVIQQEINAGRATETDFEKGGIYRAMEEGRVVILDEANYIPNEVLAELNEIMVKRVGDSVNVQEDGVDPIKVKNGYGMIMTGNIGEEYKGGRSDIDKAMANRIRTFNYEYLPQAIQGSLEEAIDEKVNGNDQMQLFEIMITSLLSERDGSLTVPGGKDGIERIWDLAMLARMTQYASQGRLSEVGSVTLGEVDYSSIKTEHVVSNRNIISIINEWHNSALTGDREAYELDYYVYKQLVESSETTHSDAILYYQMGKEMGFFQGKGWEDIDYRGSDGDINKVQLPNGLPPRNKSIYTEGKMETMWIGDVVETLYGEAPEREWSEEWFEIGSLSEEEDEDIFEELEKFRSDLRDKIEIFGTYCPKNVDGNKNVIGGQDGE